MTMPRDPAPTPDDDDPIVLGLPEQPREPEVVRIRPEHRAALRSHTPNLEDEQIRREVTLRAEGERSPETEWTDRRALPAARHIVLAVLLVLLVVLGSVTAIRILGRQNDAAPSTAAPPPRPVRPFIESASTAEIEASTRAAVQGFMNANSHAERCRFVVGGGSLEEKMRAFYERPGSPPPGRFGSILNTRDGAAGGLPVRIVFAAEDNGSVGWSFLLVSLHDRLAIDWEASVGYGQLSWEELLRDQPRQPVQMRVYLRRVPTERPEDPFHLYEVSARAEEGTILARVPANQPLATELGRAIPPGASQPANIRLRWPPPSSPSSHPVLTELLHPFWIDQDRLERSLQATQAAR